MSVNIVIVAGSALGILSIVGLILRMGYNAWSATGRDKRNRKREFRGALVEQKSFIDAPSAQLHSVSENWTFARHTFAGNVDEVRDAVPFLKRRAFDSAVARVSAISPKDVDEIAVNEQGERLLIGQKKLSDALGKLIKLLK